MRILICSNAYPPRFIGGAELVAHEQALQLQRLGHDVLVFAGDLNEGTQRHGIIVEHFDGIIVRRAGTIPEDYSPAHLNFFHPAIEAHFAETLRDFAPDIVHCHNLMGLSAKLPLLAREYGARVVCTLHDLWGFCMMNTAIRADGRACFDLSLCHECVPRIHDERGITIPMRLRKDHMAVALDHVELFIAPSRYIAERYISAGFPSQPIRVVPNGIDVDRFAPRKSAPNNPPLQISFIGHFGAHKGVSTLISALAMLERPHDVMLNLVGKGPEENRYREQIEGLDLQTSVHFCGRVKQEDIARIYDETDILVLPSVWDENQPVCIMEAMASGIAVVASRKGGIPELVEHGVSGLLFPAGDAAALARALERLIADPDLRHSMGAAGRDRVAGQSYAFQTRHQLNLFEALLQSEPKAPPQRETVYTTGDFRRKLGGRDRRTFSSAKNRSASFIYSAWATKGMLEGARGVYILNARNPIIFLLSWLSPGGIIRKPTFLKNAFLRLFDRSGR